MRQSLHVFDDATIDRVDQVHTEQMEYVDIYAQQIARWRTEKPSVAQTLDLDHMEKQNHQLRAVTAEVLALAGELRKGTINRVLAMSDLELGIQALLGTRPWAIAKPTHNIACNTLPYAFARMTLPPQPLRMRPLRPPVGGRMELPV